MANATPSSNIIVHRAGNSKKPNPFTIVIVSNPALESTRGSGHFVIDPITANHAAFASCAAYIETSLFGGLPGQAPALLADPAIAPEVRVVSLFVTGLAAVDANCLVAEDNVSNLVMTRRTRFVPFLASYGLSGDVIYAVTGSTSHTRASAYFTSDDDAQPGNGFSLDGVAFCHRYEYIIPGTIALPVGSTSITAVHEFGHALSSYSNGMIVDLYVDDGPGVNSKRARPIPPSFANYDGTVMGSDPVRDGLGYPVGWQSYHCELLVKANPAIMDDYWLAPGGVPEACQHDRITEQFLKDRLLAKISRP